MTRDAGTLWLVVALTALVSATMKGAGPAALGSRELPAWALRVVVLLAPALLAALVVTQALADGGRLHVGADTAGVATAGVLLWRGLGILPAVLVAVLVTAGLRLAGLD